MVYLNKENNPSTKFGMKERKMRRPLVIANWKMNTSLSDATILTTSIKNSTANLDVEIVLCPPFVWLYPMAEILDKSAPNINLGAQNMWFTNTGAMTGEVSPSMLKSLVKYVILGHSERRKNFNESNALINDKIISALEHNLIPLLCVGELKKSVQTRGRGRPTRADVDSDVIYQLRTALSGVSKDDLDKVVIVYEPVWAISSNKNAEPATGAYANSVAQKIRQYLAKRYGETLSEQIRILYGGSVDDDNIKEYIYQPDVDGVLVGSASLKSRDFINICREAAGRD